MTIFEELKKRDENMAEDRFRQAAREGQILFNACAHAQLIEVIGQAGWDSVLIDQQHGLGGHDEMVACLTAAKAAGMPTLVRVADNDPGLVGPALAGAEGVVCPLINSAEDAERFVRAVKDPPRGHRSWGPYRTQLMFQGTTFCRRMAGQLPVLKSRQEAMPTPWMARISSS